MKGTKVTMCPSPELLRARRALMDPRAHRGEVHAAMKSWAEGLWAGERLPPGTAIVLLDRAVELEGEPTALQVADGLSEVAELDLTVKALRLLGEHDLRPWAVEVAVRVLVGVAHLPFVSTIMLARARELGAGSAAVGRLIHEAQQEFGLPRWWARAENGPITGCFV